MRAASGDATTPRSHPAARDAPARPPGSFCPLFPYPAATCAASATSNPVRSHSTPRVALAGAPAGATRKLEAVHAHPQACAHSPPAPRRVLRLFIGEGGVSAGLAGGLQGRNKVAKKPREGALRYLLVLRALRCCAGVEWRCVGTLPADLRAPAGGFPSPGSRSRIHRRRCGARPRRRWPQGLRCTARCGAVRLERDEKR